MRCIWPLALALVLSAGAGVSVPGDAEAARRRHRPQVTITEPPNGATGFEGASVIFAGTAIDVEDGDLSPSLGWLVGWSRTLTQLPSTAAALLEMDAGGDGGA